MQHEQLLEGFEGHAFDPQPSCPICAGDGRSIGPARNIHPEKPCNFDLRRCGACSHWWIDPIPTQELLSHLYGRGSYSVIGVGWENAAKSRLTVPEQVVCKRELDGEPGEYFEIGVGKGLLFRTFRDRGWTCGGVEPGEWGAGLEGVYKSLDAVPEGRRCDVIVALDVLEHMRDPIATIERLASFAKQGARVYMAFPNCESARAKLFSGRWRMVRPMGHVHFFSRGSVERVVAKCGLALVHAEKTDLVEWRRIWAEPWNIPVGLAQLAGLGDQWIVIATKP